MTQSPGEDIGKSKRKIPLGVRLMVVFLAVFLLTQLLDYWQGDIISADKTQLSDAERSERSVAVQSNCFLSMVIVGGGMVIMLRMIRREQQNREHINEAAEDLLDRLMPGLAEPDSLLQIHHPPSPSERNGGWWAMIMVWGVASTVTVIITAPLVWLISPSLLMIIFPMIALAIFILSIQWTTLKKYAKEYEQGQAPLFDEHYWDIVGILVISGLEAGVGFLGLLLLAKGLNHVLDNLPLAILLSAAICLLAFAQAHTWHVRLSFYWMHRALRQLDYEHAMARVKHMPNLFASLCVYVLTSQGQLDEAEMLLYEMIRTARQNLNDVKRYQVLWLEQLAYLRFAQGRYDVVDPIFEHLSGTLTIKDSDGMVLSAAAHLHQGTNLPRAHAFADAAINIKHKKHWLVRIGNYFTLPEALAVQAWALARNGQPDQARQVIQTALAQSADYLPLSRASVHLYVGHTHAVLGERDAARQQYEQAAALVPEGSVGQQARRALELMTT